MEKLYREFMAEMNIQKQEVATLVLEYKLSNDEIQENRGRYQGLDKAQGIFENVFKKRVSAPTNYPD